MYQSLYTILQNGIYGALELTAEMELTLTLLSTIGSLFIVALPFLVVWKVIKAL